MYMNAHKSKKGGFTLIEILVVIGIIALLATIVIVAINPARQFAQARNTQRTSNVNSILNAVGQNIADNKGVFACAAGAIPTASTTIANDPAVVTRYDLRTCIVTAYIPEVPVDPDPAYGSHNADYSVYNTGYKISRDINTQRITVCADGAAEPAIAGSLAVCVTR